MNDSQIIGIIGGMGPLAGIDLARKIFDQTIATTDQEHLPVILMSLPGNIADRTNYLRDHNRPNPAFSVFDMIKCLSNLGVGVVGIPCNTLHSAPMFCNYLSNLPVTVIVT